MSFQCEVVVKDIKRDDIERHINLKGAKHKRRLTRSSSALSSAFLDDVAIQKTKTKDLKSGKNEDEVPVINPNLIFEDLEHEVQKTPLCGAAVFGFKTPKRSKQMAKLASQSARKMKTIHETSRKENEKPPNLSPISEKQQVSTPSKNLRSKKKFCVQEMNAPVNDESSESDANGSESEDSDENEEKISDKPHDKSQRGQSANSINLPSETELYFEAHKGGRKLLESTSDRTLRKLKLPQMDRTKLQTILESHQQNKSSKTKNANLNSKVSIEVVAIEKARQKLISDCRKEFKKWMFFVCNGFNILLYGLGSKRNLVHEFCSKMLGSHQKIVVNGYFPSLTIKSIITSISENILLEDTTTGNLQAQVDLICSRFSGEVDNVNAQDHFFLIIHNIDGFQLRNNRAQNMLSQLASAERIHIVATVDHINASLVWDHSKLSRYKWLWYDVTTFEPYIDETSYEDSLLLLTNSSGFGGSLALSGLIHVARSLTPNARGIFKLLAEFQIEEAAGSNQIGLSFSDLYQQCREKFLVNSELTLRTQLTEFLDHKLVQIKKGVDGAEYLSIPLGNATLQEYLDQAEN